MGETSTTTAEVSSDKSNSPTPTEEVADLLAVSPTSSNSLTVGRIRAGCCYLDGFNSDDVTMPQKTQMMAEKASLCLGVFQVKTGCSSFDGFSSDENTGSPMVLERDGVSYGDSILVQGKADWVISPISMGFFLAATLLRMMGARLVDYGVYGVDKAGSGSRVHLSQGVDDKCTGEIVVFESEQLDLGYGSMGGGWSTNAANGLFNKGGLFVEIFEYHNGARRGCLRVPEGTKIGGWTLFGRRLRDYFLGKSNAGLVEKVVAKGGEFEKAGDMQNPQVWKKLNGHKNKGSNLRFVKYLPNITGQRNQFESLGGFDVSKKAISASVSTTGRPVRVSHLKWTQAHFCLKITIDLMGEGKRTVSWGKFQPIVSKPDQAHQPIRENGSGQPSLDISRHIRIGDGSDDLQISEWVTGEGSGTHEDEEGEIPSFDEGLGGSPIADMNSDEGPTHKEESKEFQSSGERLNGPFVIDMKPDDHVLGSEDHGTDVEAGLSVDREPAHSPVVADQIVDHGAGCLVADTVNGACSTIVENSGCPVQVQSKVRVGLDLYFPISEVGRGLGDSEVPRLIWDATLLSGKGEEAVNPEVITPLALWDPNGSFDLVSMEDGSDGVSVEEVMEPSEWN
nr:hypothetical protein CFP56_44901 [Quercus suber]